MNTWDKLQALAANMWWSWNPEALDLFRRLNPPAFAASRNNPTAALADPNEDVLRDDRFSADVDATYDAFVAYVNQPASREGLPRTSYFCMEYGLHESFPIYSGGLGVLAGDHAKAASDLGLPFTTVGLLLREGYFQQFFTKDGWQQAAHPELDTHRHPLQLVTDDRGEPLEVTVHLGGDAAILRAWRLPLGRTTMYFLDTDVESNPAQVRWLTKRLYQGDRQNRIQQEIILGIGGLRLLRALGIQSDVYHMNEGHCAFLTLELLRERLAGGSTRADAEEWIRQQCVFTTHTPVMAGHDRFTPELFLQQMATFRTQLGLSEQELLAYGRVNPDDASESFTMTVLGLKLSRHANGVSKLNGEVAREQWRELYPDRPAAEVPIGHVTNGVHLPTWASPIARAFLSKHLGEWQIGRYDPTSWQRIDEIPDEALWDYRCALRRALVHFVRQRLPRQTLPQRAFLNPDALTIGFARRFATYKRAPLLFHDHDRAARLFNQADRPVQILYAGKAHPADDGGKRFIQQIFEMSHRPGLAGKVVFLENYDMETARMLVSGCDVWLNNPRRPMEASGTSGQKTTVHGGLNLSILDGWWPEGYDGTNGWAIGTADDDGMMDQDQRDAQDASSLYERLEQEVIPAFYERDAARLPRRWIAMMRSAMRSLPPRFSAARMVTEYVDQVYQAASAAEV